MTYKAKIMYAKRWVNDLKDSDLSASEYDSAVLEWLIQQAEKVEHLESENKKIKKIQSDTGKAI